MSAPAVKFPPDAEDGGSPLAEAMRGAAAELDRASQRVEQACLSAGEKLGETIPCLAEVGALFDRLSAALADDAFAAATDDIDLLTGELAQAAEALADEAGMLDRLAGQNEVIGKRIEDLLGFTRTMSWLVFTLKIESAPLTRLSSDMAAFAENIHKLAETTRGALEDYHATQVRLETLLRAARAAQARFRAEHQGRLAAVAAELRADLTHATERRLTAISSLRRTGEDSRALVGRIGETVVGLQIGDRTRQRIEHARDSLELMAATLEGRAPPSLRDLPSGDRESLAVRVGLLQARQIEGARSEFADEAEQAAAALGDIIGAGDALASRGPEPSAPTGEEISFLAEIEKRLGAACEAVAHFGGARAAVDEAAGSVVAIVEDMRSRTAALTNHIVDVTIIGTNALLRSMRLGDQGKGVALIARELRAYGEQTGAIIRSLPEALDGVVALAAGLAQGGRLDAAAVAGLQGRMSAAMRTFGGSHREIVAAFDALGDHVLANRDRFSQAAAILQASAEADASLRAVDDDLATAAGGVAASRRPDLEHIMDSLLSPAYTMDREREIHAEFVGANRARAFVSRRKPKGADAMVEAILL